MARRQYDLQVVVHVLHAAHALRGGGGDLGVVTELEFELFDAPELSAGALFWPIERAGPVLGAWARWTRGVPEELTSIGRLLRVAGLCNVYARRKALDIPGNSTTVRIEAE